MNRNSLQQHFFLPTLTLVLLTPWGLTAEEFVVSNHKFDEYNPDVDGHTVVWEALNSDYGDWDVYGADIENTDQPVPLSISESPIDERLPKVSQGTVVWQELYFGADDWDISGLRLDQMQIFGISRLIDDDEVAPMISGSTVVWQHKLRSYQDWDIHMADISDPLSPAYTTLAASADNEMTPSISGSLVAWKQDIRGAGDFYVSGAEVSEPNEIRPFLTFQTIGEKSYPVLTQQWVIGLNRDANGDIVGDDLYDPFLPQLIAGQTSEVAHPAAARHIVVWQDNRNGNWDIYGYNLATGQEFRITDHPADQQYPAIADLEENCFTVVWEDYRNGNSDIYGEQICDDRVAGCLSTPAYDINKDCKVDFGDFALLAEHWLEGL